MIKLFMLLINARINVDIVDQTFYFFSGLSQCYFVFCYLLVETLTIV